MKLKTLTFFEKNHKIKLSNEEIKEKNVESNKLNSKRIVEEESDEEGFNSDNDDEINILRRNSSIHKQKKKSKQGYKSIVENDQVIQIKINLNFFLLLYF